MQGRQAEKLMPNRGESEKMESQTKKEDLESLELNSQQVLFVLLHSWQQREQKHRSLLLQFEKEILQSISSQRGSDETKRQQK